MSRFERLRLSCIGILPFLAGLALGAILFVCGLVGYKVLTDWEDFGEIAEDTQRIIDNETERRIRSAAFLRDYVICDSANIQEHRLNSSAHFHATQPGVQLPAPDPLVIIDLPREEILAACQRLRDGTHTDPNRSAPIQVPAATSVPPTPTTAARTATTQRTTTTRRTSATRRPATTARPAPTTTSCQKLPNGKCKK